MISYKDKTFCASEVSKHVCGREITEEELAHAKELGLPIAYGDFCGKKEKVWEDKYERQEYERSIGLVECDSFCGAKEEPETLEEHKATLEHYKHHSYLSGCSHGC